MDNHVDERDYKLLEKDTYSFFVLRRIIGSECSLLLTDHERLITHQCSIPMQIMWRQMPAMKKSDMSCEENSAH